MCLWRGMCRRDQRSLEAEVRPVSAVELRHVTTRARAWLLEVTVLPFRHDSDLYGLSTLILSLQKSAGWMTR